jgi:hypothetical protein
VVSCFSVLYETDNCLGMPRTKTESWQDRQIHRFRVIPSVSGASSSFLLRWGGWWSIALGLRHQKGTSTKNARRLSGLRPLPPGCAEARGRSARWRRLVLGVP